MKYISIIWQCLLPKEKKGSILLSGLMILAMLFETLGIGLIIPIINILINPDDVRDFLASMNMSFFANLSDIHLAIMLMSSICIFYLLKNLYLFFFIWWQMKFATEVRISLSTRIYKNYLYKPYEFFLKNNSSLLIRNINNETDNFQNALLSIVILVSEFLVVTGLISFLLYIEPMPILIASLVMGVSAYIFNTFSKKGISIWSKERVYHQGEIFKSLIQGFGGFKALRILNRQKYFFDIFNNHIVKYSSADRWFKTLQQSPRLWLEFVAILLLTLIVLTLLILEIGNESLFIILGVYAATAFRLLPSVNKIIMSFQRLRFVLPSVKIIHSEITSFQNVLKSPKEKVSTNEKSLKFLKHISINKLDFSYSKEKKILDNIDLLINKNESIGIIGESGSGKSTLIDLIMGLLTPNKGSISVDGINIDKDYSQWHSIIGYVPQDIYLLDDTIRKNIALGLNDEKIDENQVKFSLQAAQLDNLVNSLPEGLDTIVGERGVRLSGGQRQRIGIARALYTNPDIIILDEATSSLDFETEKNIMISITKLKGIKTLIIVSHRMSTIQDCDKIYEIQNNCLRLK